MTSGEVVRATPLATVIICAHNPPKGYLGKVMEALQRQTLPRAHWELLLVDNASQDPLASSWDLSWHGRASHLREDELGLSSARMRGIAAASSELLVYVDDDNVLHPRYLEESTRIAQAWPQLGVWGGSITPEFEVPPSEELRDYCCYLALREIAEARWSNVPGCLEATPWGAGMCVRRSVAAAYVDKCRNDAIRIQGRQGASLLSGEDIEICMVSCELGLGTAVFPELRLVHLIPARRVEEEYLVRLAESIKTSSLVLDYKWRGIRPASPFSPLGVLRLAKNLAVKRGVDRKVYLASVRSVMKARRIIAESGAKAS